MPDIILPVTFLEPYSELNQAILVAVYLGLELLSFEDPVGLWAMETLKISGVINGYHARGPSSQLHLIERLLRTIR